MAEIYGLYDPIDGKLKYVGKASCAKKRLKGHMQLRKARVTPVYEWINSLVDMGLSPRMQVIEVCHDDLWTEREIALISSLMPPLNVAKGGNEPYCPREVRVENGRANAKIIHSDPVKKRIWQIKRDLGQLLKQGHVRENTKERIRAVANRYPEVWGCFSNI